MKVTIARGRGAVSLPSSFFGLSIEYSELPRYESVLPVFERLVSLVHVRDDGPLVLRIGGDSADQTYWNPGSRRLPAGSFVLTPRWFQQTRALVRQLRLHVILDLNLAAHSPSMATGLARVALARLPAGSIIGWEIGNEPDRYGHRYSISKYVRDFRLYARALKHVEPRLPVMGPAITSTSTDFGWLAGVMPGDRAELGVLTGHRYPLSACEKQGSPLYPTIAKVLSASLSTGMAQTVSPAVRLAHRARRPFRLDELNSVTCGGVAGVSDTFATALWAPDALFELLRTGLDGLNVHVRPGKINGPLAVTSSGMIARPLLYGMILFAETVGPSGRLLHDGARGPGSAQLKAWAVDVVGGIEHVLLINKGSGAVNVDLRASGVGNATAERLLAPSASATSGVTLAGQHLGLNGDWIGAPVIQRIHPSGAGYQLTVPGLSAALVSVQLRRAV